MKIQKAREFTISPPVQAGERRLQVVSELAQVTLSNDDGTAAAAAAALIGAVITPVYIVVKENDQQYGFSLVIEEIEELTSFLDKNFSLKERIFSRMISDLS